MKMLRTLGLLLPLACATAAWADTDPGQRQAEQVAAFARLYGVVRYFHPGDATQEVDWNRFAVYGAQQAQAAPDREALGQTLRELFTPIAAGVQVLPENQLYPPAPAPVHDPARIDLKPAAPRFGGRIAFLSGGAISYAESVLGYVADEHLATIVGAPSAGTNGNIQRFVTPGDYSIVFTGMRTTRHDGHSRYHLIGAVPGIAVAPTLAGFRAGHDEVLERALQVLAAGGDVASTTTRP